eukprot:763142-Hanusia_phi.AAC.4
MTAIATEGRGTGGGETEHSLRANCTEDLQSYGYKLGKFGVVISRCGEKGRRNRGGVVLRPHPEGVG